ncbi:VQ motif-containing protein 25-like [Olea europaea var. sylvestris]|uniref:VQ motif-containing protein 25-like n=1 Tax=Olea europaea var. sylvestris TaxID=158386 RepID=UPI000C1D8C86|nr:VQ motif-containing protein 25-like [Olea europaea var. sylvestris]
MKQPQTCETILTPSKLGLDKYSHTISKIKPKIRVIHIVAPEIIKTDVENFRELVQRLTGKPTTGQGKGKSTKKGNDNVSESMKKMDSSGDVPVSQSSKHRMKKEISEEMLYVGHSSNGFMSFLGDVDCFINIQEMNEFHLPPFRSSSQMNLLGEMHLC